MRITEHIRRLKGYVHGEQPSGRGVVKLNTNENAYPPSPKCAEALKRFPAAALRLYPNAESTPLRKAIAALHGTSPDNVFVGNGSDEILSLAAKVFVGDDEAIGSLDPSYSLYKTLADIRNVPWKGFREGSDVGKWNLKGVSLFLWTNPNAPTGRFVEPREIAAFAKKFPGVVIVDEAYADFARGNAMALATAPRNRNIVVMRTFSKSYSLAGLRVGYCVGPKDLIAALMKTKDSYNVDGVAQAVALAAVRDQAWKDANCRKIVLAREKCAGDLRKRGWDVPPSESNFLFARPPVGTDPEHLFQKLKEKNIFIRYFSGKLTRDRLRISIGTPREMEKFIAAIDAIQKGK